MMGRINIIWSNKYDPTNTDLYILLCVYLYNTYINIYLQYVAAVSR